MGVDVTAILEWNKSIGSIESIEDLMNNSCPFFGYLARDWKFELENFPNVSEVLKESGAVYLSSEELSNRVGDLLIGPSLVMINKAIRWSSFCENFDGAYIKNIDHYRILASTFGSNEIIFIPDSSFNESKAIDLVESEVNLKEFEAYLHDMGSKRVLAKNIISTDNQVWKSFGYIYESIIS